MTYTVELLNIYIKLLDPYNMKIYKDFNEIYIKEVKLIFNKQFDISPSKIIDIFKISFKEDILDLENANKIYTFVIKSLGSYHDHLMKTKGYIEY